MALIEQTRVFAIQQAYDDGHVETFSIGDETEDGVIVGFARTKSPPPHDYWYALTDQPSDWQKEQGMNKGWSWIYQLKKLPPKEPFTEPLF